MMKRFLALLLAMLMLLVMASACSTDENGEESNGEEGNETVENNGEATGDEDVIKIGVFEPLSGANAAGGEMEYEGIQVAHSLKNEVLGKKIVLVPVDNKSDDVEAVNAAVRLVDSEKVDIVLGSWGSSVAIANFFRSIEYRHILPQAVRDPQGFSAVPVMNDPYGRDIVRQIWATPHKTREARLRRIDKALQIAVPTLTELKVEMDENLGQPHLRAKFQHWRPNGAIQDESSFSDGTLRLIALFWMLLEKGGPLLLEEPELSLNEEIVRQLPTLFARLIRGKQGRQVLISTHSYALLDDPGIQSEEVLKLEPGKGGTVMRPLSDDAAKLMENGLSAAAAVLPEIRQDRMEQLSLLSL